METQAPEDQTTWIGQITVWIGVASYFIAVTTVTERKLGILMGVLVLHNKVTTTESTTTTATLRPY